MSTKTTTRRPSGTLNALESALGVSKRRVSALLRDGMPDDPEAALAWRAERSGGDGSADELRRERIKLIQSQRRKLDFEHAVEQGQYLAAAAVRESTVRVISAARDRLLKLPAELPPQLEGLPPAAIARTLHSAVMDILTELSSELTYAEPAK
jgi:hypothetical protein